MCECGKGGGGGGGIKREVSLENAEYIQNGTSKRERLWERWSDRDRSAETKAGKVTERQFRDGACV